MTIVDLLAAVERQFRERLHRAANRIEDADPVAVHGSLTAIRVLNGIDRIIAFRARHQAARGLQSERSGAARTASPR